VKPLGYPPPEKSATDLTRWSEIKADSYDPDGPSPAGFAERLHKMGIVNPTPTFSPSSTATPVSQPPSAARNTDTHSYSPPPRNRTLASLDARRELQEKAEAEFHVMGRKGSSGREFLDIATICRALEMRKNGVDAADIESRLNLKAGVVARLGRPGVAAHLEFNS
jgi:hypothetical protein